jgi:hypothetical protein
MKKMRMRESKKERMINYASIFQGNYWMRRMRRATKKVWVFTFVYSLEDPRWHYWENREEKQTNIFSVNAIYINAIMFTFVK